MYFWAHFSHFSGSVTLFPFLLFACLNPKDMERSCIILNLCSNVESTLDVISCAITSTSWYRNLWVHSISTCSASKGKPQLGGFWELIYLLLIWSSVSLMVLCSSFLCFSSCACGSANAHARSTPNPDFCHDLWSCHPHYPPLFPQGQHVLKRGVGTYSLKYIQLKCY